jgi:hypothetical protein
MNSVLVRHIKKFQDTEWNFKKLSHHPNLTMNVLKEYPKEQWDFYNGVSLNKNWNWNWVRELPNENWNWDLFSESIYFKWFWVRELPYKPWNWASLSNIATVEILSEFPDKPWDWKKLTLSENTPVKDMMNTSYFPWQINDLFFISVDKEEVDFMRFFRSHYDEYAWADHTIHTPWSLIKHNLDLPWKIKNITIVDDFDENDIQYLYSLKGWNMDYMSSVIGMNIITKCSDLPWNMDIVSRKRDRNYTNLKWNMHIVNLDFEKSEWFAASVIQRYWRKCATDPSYSMCKRLVLYELNDALKECNISNH